MAERSFTPAEANNALAEVRPVAERLVAVRTRMRELEHAQGELVTAIGGNGGGYAASDLNAAQSELGSLADAALACVERLEELGVVIKDLDLGLLDFPAERGGRECTVLARRGGVGRSGTASRGLRRAETVDWSE
jgi:hypothetical protein